MLGKSNLCRDSDSVGSDDHQQLLTSDGVDSQPAQSSQNTVVKDLTHGADASDSTSVAYVVDVHSVGWWRRRNHNQCRADGGSLTV